MMTLKTVRKMQDARKPVLLDDGRVGKIVRVDTMFPGNRTEVSVYTFSQEGPSIAKVPLERLHEARGRTVPSERPIPDPILDVPGSSSD